MPDEDKEQGPGTIVNRSHGFRSGWTEDEQEAQHEVSHDPLMQPHLWPMLERPASPEQLGQVVEG